MKGAGSLDISRSPKRTRRRANSKSVIQNAIARKEKSFDVYEKPKSKNNRVKAKVLTGDKKIGEFANKAQFPSIQNV